MRVDERDYWRCRACQVTFLDPGQRPDPAVERAEYLLHQNDAGQAGYRRFLGRLALPLLARLAPNSRGLDYGCGPGPVLAALLREAGHEMALYDPLFADDRAVLAQTYDFITCTEVAEHFHDPAREFRRLGDLLKPGGVLAVMTSFQTEDARFADWHYRRDPTHVIFYREASFRDLARRQGWRCEIPCQNVVLLFRQTAAGAPAFTLGR